MKRNERSLKKKLFSATDTSEKKKCKVHNVQAEEVAVAKVKENHEKRQTLTDLRQANKQLNQSFKKKHSLNWKAWRELSQNKLEKLV